MQISNWKKIACHLPIVCCRLGDLWIARFTGAFWWNLSHWLLQYSTLLVGCQNGRYDQIRDIINLKTHICETTILYLDAILLSDIGDYSSL